MSVGLNRLNFTNMVEKKFPYTETYFNPTIVMGRNRGKDVTEISQPPPLTPSVNNILATVHRRLKKEIKPKPASIRTDKEMTSQNASKEDRKVPSAQPKIDPLSKLNIKNKDNLKPVQLAAKENKMSHLEKATTIPQIKAVRDQRNQQRMRRNISNFNDSMNVLYSQRVIEMKKQKRILQDMMNKHQRLQRDRQNIAMEIQTMREHLSEITRKLDVSLKQLSTRPIIVENPEIIRQARPFPKLRPPLVKRIVQVRRTRPAPNLRTPQPNSGRSISPRRTTPRSGTKAASQDQRVAKRSKSKTKKPASR